jgi:glycosyltransferase involved in cell wall biosynthesis
LSIRASVVVPTYKRNHLLGKCLHSLVNQDFPPDAYEIIVVDDAASVETQSFVENFVGTAKQIGPGSASRARHEVDPCPEIIYAAAPLTKGPAAARNIGWQVAHGEIIAFTDDDCLPEPDWLKEGIAALQDDMTGVSGQVIVPISNPPTDYEKNISGLEGAVFVTANCFYRRSALETCGGFDERFTMAWREDSELFFHMLSLSCKLAYAPLAKVVHPVRCRPWGVSITEQRKSIFDALLYKKYPELYRERIRPSYPVKYYVIVFSLIGFVVALATESRFIAMLLFVIWAALTLQFAFQRLRQTKRTLSHIAEMLFTSIVIPPLSVFWKVAGMIKYGVWFF